MASFMYYFNSWQLGHAPLDEARFNGNFFLPLKEKA